jgi:hypothetical protein
MKPKTSKLQMVGKVRVTGLSLVVRPYYIPKRQMSVQIPPKENDHRTVFGKHNSYSLRFFRGRWMNTGCTTDAPCRNRRHQHYFGLHMITKGVKNINARDRERQIRFHNAQKHTILEKQMFKEMSESATPIQSHLSPEQKKSLGQHESNADVELCLSVCTSRGIDGLHDIDPDSGLWQYCFRYVDNPIGFDRKLFAVFLIAYKRSIGKL